MNHGRRLERCYGCGDPVEVDDVIPAGCVVWCATCVVADVPVLMAELADEVDGRWPRRGL